MISPIYSVILVSVGTLFGRHRFFANMAQKIAMRLIPGSLKPKKALCQAVARPP